MRIIVSDTSCLIDLRRGVERVSEVLAMSPALSTYDGFAFVVAKERPDLHCRRGHLRVRQLGCLHVAWLQPRLNRKHANAGDAPGQANNNAAVKNAAPRLTDVLKGDNERNNPNGQGVYRDESSACGMKVAHTKERGEKQTEEGRAFLQRLGTGDNARGKGFLETLIALRMSHERRVEDKHCPVTPVPWILKRLK